MQRTTTAVLTGAAGAHVELYFASLAEIPEAESVAVADVSGDSEAAARRILGPKLIDFQRDHARVLRQHRPAMALVSLEAVQSPPVIQAALDADCHVLAEKPACVRVEDFEPLARLADMKHRSLMLAFANRLLGTVQKARSLIRTGQIGSLYGCELHLIADQTRLRDPQYHASWFADRARAGGGHLAWLGIHWLDLIMYLTGSAIAEAAWFTGIVGGQPLKCEDSAAMVLRFESGICGTFTSGYYLDQGYHSHFRIWGSQGWLQLDPHGIGEPLVWYSTREANPQLRKYEGPPDDSSYTPLVRACVQACVAGSAPPPLTTADSLRALRTLFACYRAAREGRSQQTGAPGL